jgi:SNF2 family DNA or RNA helicase
LGQKNAVNAIYFLAENTIDEEIFSLIAQKRDVVTAATEGFTPESAVETVAQKLIMDLFDLGVAAS